MNYTQVAIYAGAGLVILVVLYWLFSGKKRERFPRDPSQPPPQGAQRPHGAEQVPIERPSEKDPLEEAIDELNKRGFVVLGREGCPWCTKQMDEFGPYATKVRYVDCENPQNEQMCQGIENLPTLRMGEKQHAGYLPINDLVQKFLA